MQQCSHYFVKSYLTCRKSVMVSPVVMKTSIKITWSAKRLAGMKFDVLTCVKDSKDDNKNQFIISCLPLAWYHEPVLVVEPTFLLRPMEFLPHVLQLCRSIYWGSVKVQVSRQNFIKKIQILTSERGLGMLESATNTST